jgi:hypothetical protein
MRPPMNQATKTAREFLKNHSPLCLVIFVFFASRVIYFFYFGVRFDCVPLYCFWQFIDPELLKNNLLQSVYYLHSQPPLFNLFLGIVLKLFPANYPTVFYLIYMAIGVLFCVTLFILMTEMGMRPSLSAGLTCLFTASPLVVDYENWLFYEYPTAALLIAGALFLHRFSVNKKTSDSFIFFLILALIVYIRGLLSLYWFLLVLIILLAFNSGQRKKIINGCAIPFILILDLYTKQYVIFDTFSISDALIGQNLIGTATEALPRNTIGALTAQGKITGLNRWDIFSLDFPRYESYGIHRKKTGIPILDETKKSTGFVNAHNLIYLDAGRRDLKDAAYLLAHYPMPILRNRIENLVENYYLTTDQINPPVYDRTPRWEAWRDWYKKFFLGATSDGKSLLLTTGLQFLLIYGFFLLFWPFATKEIIHPPKMVITFMITTIFFLMVPTQFVIDGQNRYRFMVDPFYLILFGLFLNDAWKILSGSRRPINDG